MDRLTASAINSFNSSAKNNLYQASCAEARGDVASASRYRAQSILQENIANELAINTLARKNRRW